jgi:hypothetical protein
MFSVRKSDERSQGWKCLPFLFRFVSFIFVLFTVEVFVTRFLFYLAVAPVLWIPNQLEGTVVGQQVSLVCQIEAFPIPIVYWTTESGEIIIDSMKQ